MNKANIRAQLKQLALSFFRKGFFGIYHGSISAKTENSRFMINTKDALFDSLDEKSLIELYFQKDYRWKQASIDADIHNAIYEAMSDAKFVCFATPPNITAYALKHNVITPKDYFGTQIVGNIEIYDPKSFEDWYDRASSEIAHYFQTHKTNIMVIRGYGVFAFHRDIAEIAKLIAITEESCRLLLQERHSEGFEFD